MDKEKTKETSRERGSAHRYRCSQHISITTKESDGSLGKMDSIIANPNK